MASTRGGGQFWGQQGGGVYDTIRYGAPMYARCTFHLINVQNSNLKTVPLRSIHRHLKKTMTSFLSVKEETLNIKSELALLKAYMLNQNIILKQFRTNT